MKEERHFVGACLIGLGLLSNSENTRFGLGLLGTAFLFPRATALVAVGVMEGIVEHEKKKEEEKEKRSQKPQPIIIVVQKQEAKKGFLRRLLNRRKD